MIAALLKWTGLSQWMMELIALGAVAGGVWLYLHHVYETGVKAEVAVVAKQAAAQHAKDLAAANAAEHSHDDELNSLRAFQLAHPDTPATAVRLCVNSSVQGASASQVGPKSDGASAATAGVQSVPAGDSGSGTGQAGPDILPMLSALAARADQVSAQLRAVQEAQQ